MGSQNSSMGDRMKSATGFWKKAIWGVLSLLVAAVVLTPCAAQAFTATSLGDYDNVTVMEDSGDYDVAFFPDGSADMSARKTISQEFYRTHGDDYDFLVIFTNFDFIMPPGAKAFLSQAKSDVQGIGQDLFDNTYAYTPDSSYLDRFEGTIDMANLTSHVTDPLDPDFEKTLLTLSHEVAHRWAAYIEYIDENAQRSSDLLGYADAHWSYLLDSEGSTLYGNN